MEQLKKCPFCGGENIGVWERKTYSFFPPLYAVHCYDCHYGLQELSTKEKAIAAWNTRKPMERIVERLENEKGFEVFAFSVSSRNCGNSYKIGYETGLNEAIEIVKEEIQ